MKALSSWFAINRALVPAMLLSVGLSAFLALAVPPRAAATKRNSTAIILGAAPQCPASAVFSASFTQGQGASAETAQQWVNFRQSLVPAGYDTVTISGTFDTTGRTLTDATIVPQIAAALKNSTAASFTVGSVAWVIQVGSA